MKIIIDTDMLIDDWMGILYLLQRKDIEIVGIAVTGTGGSYLKPGSHNALSLLKIANLDTKVPVSAGIETPLLYSNLYPKSIRDHATNFMGIPIPPSQAALYPDTITTFYSNLLKNASEKITILSIGGASNLGSVLPKISTLKNKIEQIFVMGGAIDTKGNLSDLTDTYSFNQVAEWNIFIDVAGAQTLFQSGIPITLIPLDACTKVVFTKDYANDFRNQAKGVIADYMNKMFDAYFQSVGGDSITVFDPLAAVVMANFNTSDIKKLIPDQQTIKISVEQLMKVSGTPDTAGQTKRDEQGQPINVAMAADQTTFNNLFLAPFLS